MAASSDHRGVPLPPKALEALAKLQTLSAASDQAVSVPAAADPNATLYQEQSVSTPSSSAGGTAEEVARAVAKIQKEASMVMLSTDGESGLRRAAFVPFNPANPLGEREAERMRKALLRNFELVAEKDRARLEAQARKAEEAKRRESAPPPRQQGQKRRGDPNAVIYASGLPEHIIEENIERLFSVYGTVRRVKLYRTKEGVPKGDALITLTRAADAARAIEDLNGVDLAAGQPIQLSIADFGRKNEASRESVEENPAPATADVTKDEGEEGSDVTRSLIKEVYEELGPGLGFQTSRQEKSLAASSSKMFVRGMGRGQAATLPSWMTKAAEPGVASLQSTPGRAQVTTASSVTIQAPPCVAARPIDRVESIAAEDGEKEPDPTQMAELDDFFAALEKE